MLIRMPARLRRPARRYDRFSPEREWMGADLKGFENAQIPADPSSSEESSDENLVENLDEKAKSPKPEEDQDRQD